MDVEGAYTVKELLGLGGWAAIYQICPKHSNLSHLAVPALKEPWSNVATSC